MFKEFKEFAMRGNVVDLAIGVVIGAAFGKIIDSLVGDVIMPVVGKLTGGVDFSNKFVSLAGQDASMPYAKAKEAGAALGWGMFVNQIITFMIVAFALFLVVKAMNKMKKPAEAAAPAGPSETDLLVEIRDLLKKS